MNKNETVLMVQLGAVIPTGEYQNIQPHYEIKVTVDKSFDQSKIIDDMRKLLQSKIDLDFEKVRITKIKKQREDIRITEKDGKHYPHVTSIIGAIEPINYDKALLRQYGSRGTLVHAQWTYFFRTQRWETDVLKIPGTKLDYMIMTQGSLKLSLEPCNSVGFWKKHEKDFAIIDVETKLFNNQYLYCGTRDILGRYKNKLSIIDIKTSTNYNKDKLDRYWRQLAAYAKCEKDIEQLVIIPLTPAKKDGFDTPYVTEEIDKYFALFLQDREAFKQIYDL